MHFETKKKNEMKKREKLGKLMSFGLCAALSIQMSAFAADTEGSDSGAGIEEKGTVEQILDGMTLDEKISQMIIPAIRMWNGVNVTDLEEADGLAEALCRHQYGGIILYQQNVTGTRQTYELVRQLKENNAQIEGVSTSIPYFIAADEEGGRVARLMSGCRMTGSMAIAATGDMAEKNSESTGKLLGEEMKALGFNVDYAPVIDVNNNPGNPVIGTRSFSDDPDTVTKLGIAYARGLEKNNIIATYKHFPGHGDTTVDSHIGTPSVEKTYEELQKTELVPFREAIAAGADMIMTAHITYPLIDEKVTFGDGVTQGYYPATMSRKMITDILRGDMGFDGIVVADALEMGAIQTAGLVPGEEGSAEYSIHIAEKVINAGVDILLVPADLLDESKADFYDDYISGISDLVEDGTVPLERIDESVSRILEVKEKYGILDEEQDLDQGSAADAKGLIYALKTVGSYMHHDIEGTIARSAVTLVKNDNAALPVSGDVKKIVFLSRCEGDRVTIEYAVQKLLNSGIIGEDAKITYDYYYDPSAEEGQQLHYTEEMKKSIEEADVVVGFSALRSLPELADGAPQYEGLHSAIEDVHAGGGKFILLSTNLPYDTARYQDADAILLTYLDTALDKDPTQLKGATEDTVAYNANVIAAIDTVFGENEPSGTLPVNIPGIVGDKESQSLEYSDEHLYERGFGLTY